MSEHPIIGALARSAERLRDAGGVEEYDDADRLDDAADLLRRHASLLPAVATPEATEPVEGVITGIILTPGERVHYATRDLDTIESLQAVVDGPIEPVQLDAETTMYFNEEGKMDDLPPNPVATRLLAAAGGRPGDWVAGTALIVGITPEGASTFVPKHWLTAFPDEGASWDESYWSPRWRPASPRRTPPRRARTRHGT